MPGGRKGHLTRCKARIWPPPSPDDGSCQAADCADVSETSGDGAAEGDDDGAEKGDAEKGDAKELAMWLLGELAEAGPNKKKVGRTRLQLLALEIPLASAVACLSEVCRTAPPPAAWTSRADETAGAGRKAAAKFEALKQQTLERLEGQLPSKRSTYDTAAELVLEYVGETISLAGGSTNTIFATLAAEGAAGGKKKHIAPTGGALSAAVQPQVEALVIHILQQRAYLNPTLLYRLTRLTKLSVPTLYSTDAGGLTPEMAGRYIQAAVESGGYENVPSALVKALACPSRYYPPAQVGSSTTPRQTPQP